MQEVTKSAVRKKLAMAGRLAAAIFWMGSLNALAQQSYTIDPQQSEIHFTLTDVLHVVHGSFRLQPGSTIVFDPTGGTMSGNLVVDAHSGTSGNETRDRKMTNEELKAPTFSTVTFAAKSYTGTVNASGDSKIDVVGTFTIIGTPHEITVPMQVHIDGAQCRATGSFQIPYVKWGMKDPSTFVLRVAKEVSIDLVLVGQLAPH